MPDLKHFHPVDRNAVADHKWPDERELSPSAADLSAAHRKLLKAVPSLDQALGQALSGMR